MSLLVICFLIQISFTPITSITYFCSLNSTCGCSLNSAVLTKIIGGEEVDPYTWSWAVSIRFGRSHLCGGSLISSQLVVTAAHCFASIEEISRLTVTAGSEYLFSINQQRTISEVYIHQDYDSATYANDIAVIRLSTPFDMNHRSLALICLPTQTLEIPMNNTDVVAIGWGTLALNSKLPSDILQQVTLKTIPNTYSTCRLTIRNVRVQFCAGVRGGGKDTCQGDSGGPLMMFINRQWYLIGITSYGIECALSTNAGIYTKVSVYEKELVCLLKNDTKCARKIFRVRNSVASIFGGFYKLLFFIFFIFLLLSI